MKKRRVIIASLAMMMVSMAACVTGTVAWFTASNSVKATGMQVKAKAENGIVIRYGDDDFKETANAGMTTAVELKPTTTCECNGDWYYASSDEQDDAKAEQDAENYTAVTTSDADDYYVVKKFDIRSSAAAVAVNNVKLGVKSVAVTRTTSTSAALDKAIRVGVQYKNADDEATTYIYAPLADTALPYTPGFTGASEVSAPKTAPLDTNNKPTNLFVLDGNAVPANDTGLSVYVYMWFEGEDENCKSTNITATLDNLNVTVDFMTVDIA